MKWICKNEVVKKDVTEIEQYFPEQYEKFGINNSSGEHYKLLSYLSDQLSGKILIDAGTSIGISALALGLNKKNTVFSYDVVASNPIFARDYANISFKQLDINLESSDFLKSAAVILLDIDPHDGQQERRFLKTLQDIGYAGYLVVDDIHLNANMSQFWKEIDFEKFDLTDIAHWSGTGMVDFTGLLQITEKCPNCEKSERQ